MSPAGRDNGAQAAQIIQALVSLANLDNEEIGSRDADGNAEEGAAEFLEQLNVLLGQVAGNRRDREAETGDDGGEDGEDGDGGTEDNPDEQEDDNYQEIWNEFQAEFLDHVLKMAEVFQELADKLGNHPKPIRADPDAGRIAYRAIQDLIDNEGRSAIARRP